MRYLLRTLVGTLVGAIVTVPASTVAGVAGPEQALAQPPSPQQERFVVAQRERFVVAQPKASRYSLLQMNLCLSGFASCFQRYPKVVDEAIGVISAQPVDAVAFNEACSRDVFRIARETGYHARFAPVLHDGRPLSCVKPGGRGVFGNALMTRQPVTGWAQHAFRAQAGTEERRWICVETAQRLDVCGTHLSTRDSPAARRANDRQCNEFASVLAARRKRGRLMAAGDLNRRRPCTPAGVWARTDGHAPRLPGRQHGYGGTRGLRPLRPHLLRAAHTDHAFLLVQARLVRHTEPRCRRK